MSNQMREIEYGSSTLDDIFLYNVHKSFVQMFVEDFDVKNVINQNKDKTYLDENYYKLSFNKDMDKETISDLKIYVFRLNYNIIRDQTQEYIINLHKDFLYLDEKFNKLFNAIKNKDL